MQLNHQKHYINVNQAIPNRTIPSTGGPVSLGVEDQLTEIPAKWRARMNLVPTLRLSVNHSVNYFQCGPAWRHLCPPTVNKRTLTREAYKWGPGPCITNVFATRRKNFSQWHRSFQRKLLSYWLKFLRHVAITLVIQGPVATVYRLQKVWEA